MTSFLASPPFSSIQGEGIMAGVRQIFVRFADCNLECVYCDTDKGRYKRLSLNDILRKIKELDMPRGLHHSVSITGGEPLCYPVILKKLLPGLKKIGFKVYLETNGTLPDNLKRVIKDVDIIAMDIKLPSSTGGEGFWREHLEFLKLAVKKDVFVKLIVTGDTVLSDIKKAAALVNRIDSKIPVCIQPATTGKRMKHSISGKKLMRFQEEALKRLKDVRVIPQIHKELKLK